MRSAEGWRSVLGRNSRDQYPGFEGRGFVGDGLGVVFTWNVADLELFGFVGGLGKHSDDLGVRVDFRNGI